RKKIGAGRRAARTLHGLRTRPMTPRPVQHTRGSELEPCSSRPEPPSMLRARTDFGGRLFTAKLAGVVHDFTHQMFDHLLTDDPISFRESGATGETKKAAHGFRQSGADWETAAACVKMETESSVPSAR